MEFHMYGVGQKTAPRLSESCGVSNNKYVIKPCLVFNDNHEQ